MKRAISGAGRLHALAVTTATRMKALPDVPTVSDFVPGYEASNVNGVGVPWAQVVKSAGLKPG